MRSINYFIAAFLILGSLAGCSDDDKEIVSKPSFKLSLNKDTYEPFEVIEISLQSNQVFSELYDEIKWHSDKPELSPLLRPKTGSDKHTNNYTTSELMPGEHQIVFEGYKNGELVNKESIKYQITNPKGNFLSTQWKTLKEEKYIEYYSPAGLMSYVAEEKNYARIKLSHYLPTANKPEVKSEYAVLDFMPISINLDKNTPPSELKFPEATDSQQVPILSDYCWNIELIEKQGPNFSKTIDFTRQLFHTYITQLYGKSTFIYKGEDPRETNLWEEYNKRFRNDLIKIYPSVGSTKSPVEIWDTPHSSICLYALHTGWHYVIAEPKH